MNKETNYSLFVPPASVNSKKPSEWSYDEAKVYFNWMMEIKEERINYFLSFLNETRTSDPEEDLRRIGQKTYFKLLSEPFSVNEEGKKVLTNVGLALAADVSLLLAECILEKHPELKWGIVRRPKKDLSFHLPALMPYPKYGHLELMRTSIVNARNMIVGKETSDVWLDIFKAVDERLKNS